MTFCDHILFWHHHRQRPRLVTSIALGGGYTEHMREDGQIERKYYTNEDLFGGFNKALTEAFEARTALFSRF